MENDILLATSWTRLVAIFLTLKDDPMVKSADIKRAKRAMTKLRALDTYEEVKDFLITDVRPALLKMDRA